MLTTALIALGVTLTDGVASSEGAADNGGLTVPPDQDTYYVSLGDSLSVGTMPDAQGHDHISQRGYAEAIKPVLGRTLSNLHLVKLGCSGETSSSLIHGDRTCYRRRGDTQLGEATAFLRSHRGQVALVTVDVGTNDVERCGSGGTLDRGCLRRGLAGLQRNMQTILSGLSSAAGPNPPPLLGLNSYDPMLAYWVTGPGGPSRARATLPLFDALNSSLARAFRANGFTLVDVAGRFSGHDFSNHGTSPGFVVPRAVDRVCRWTFSCSPPPRDLDDHANPTGYRVIAGSILGTMGRAIASRGGR